MKKVCIADILKLSLTERILLVEDIWDSIVEAPEAIPLTDAQKEGLERRLEAYHGSPSMGSPWHEVVARIKSVA